MNQLPSALRDDAQPTEPHLSGLYWCHSLAMTTTARHSTVNHSRTRPISQMQKQRPSAPWGPAAPRVPLPSLRGHTPRSPFGRSRFGRGSTRRPTGRIVFSTTRLGNYKHRGRGDSDVTRHNRDRSQGSVNIVSGGNHSGAPGSSQTPVRPVGSRDEPNRAGHLALSLSSLPKHLPASVSFQSISC